MPKFSHFDRVQFSLFIQQLRVHVLPLLQFLFFRFPNCCGDAPSPAPYCPGKPHSSLIHSKHSWHFPTILHLSKTWLGEPSNNHQLAVVPLRIFPYDCLVRIFLNLYNRYHCQSTSVILNPSCVFILFYSLDLPSLRQGTSKTLIEKQITLPIFLHEFVA